MLSVSDLNVRYGMHQALSSINLHVERDEIVVILGANGAGKSSLLSAIAGNCEGKTEGQVKLKGQQLLGQDASRIVDEGVAFVPEGRGVFSDLSVEENLLLGAYTEHAQRSEQANLSRVLSLFPKLAERRKQLVRTMSGGEQQMVAIGRALMSAPSILMLDEPSLGLSPLLCKELFSSLKQVRDSGVGILLVEQNAKQSLSISDRGYLLGNGEIIGHDKASNLLTDPKVQAAYLGGALAAPVGTANKSLKDNLQQPSDTRSESSSGSPAGLIIEPGRTVVADTLSSDELLHEDINALVARASSAASQQRGQGQNLPLQVVKLSTQSAETHSNKPTTQSKKGNSSHNLDLELPSSQDEEVRALLDEFEAAANNAARGSVKTSSLSTTSRINSEPEDDLNALPHIPIFKKSSVTVYKRDSAGTLRKQEKS